jgi:chemotaxis protein MotB
VARPGLGLLLGVLLATGCVGRGSHSEVVAERDRLAERVRLLEASNESLSGERVRLIDQIEDLQQSEAELLESVGKLERRGTLLQQSLDEREAALAARSEELGRLRGTYDGLVSDLEAELQAGQIQIERLREGLRLNLSDAILFDSGSATLKPGGREVLARVATRLNELPDRVEVQGHTDDVPISRPFASNWELAGARATGVVRWLESRGVDPTRLSGVSFGEHHPVAPNDTAEGRARNRRIEIRLLPRAPAPAQEASEAPGGE